MNVKKLTKNLQFILILYLRIYLLNITNYIIE